MSLKYEPVSGPGDDGAVSFGLAGDFVELEAMQEQLLNRNAQRFRGGLVFKARRLFYHSPVGLRVIKRERDTWR